MAHYYSLLESPFFVSLHGHECGIFMPQFTLTLISNDSFSFDTAWKYEINPVVRDYEEGKWV